MHTPAHISFALSTSPAACPLWKKLKSGGAVPHLARWFDHMAGLPECVAAVEELDSRGKPKGSEGGAAGSSKMKGGGGERAGVQEQQSCALAACS